jgi:hypothetical protein
VTFAYCPSVPRPSSSALALVAALAAGAACGDNALPPEVPPPPPTAARAVVVSGDFDATGVLSVVDVAAGTIRANAVRGAVGADPMIRHQIGRAHV